MTVAELIDALRKLPQDLEVFHNWEGELHSTKVAEEITAKSYSGGTLWVDYFPEAELDADEVRKQVCFVGSSTNKI